MKILAVDDDGVALDLLRECMIQGGYEYVTLMSSPVKVLATLENTAIPYDCILLDVEMPKINGIQLCAEIRQLSRYRNTPILMITKRSDHASIKQAFVNGATDYITKPFEVFEVLIRIKVAERLVQERQAAIDSYMAVNANQDRKQNLVTGSIKGCSNKKLDEQPNGIIRDNLISLSTLHNYLDRAILKGDCELELIAIKILHISDIFERTTATEFLRFLEFAARSSIEAIGGKEAFIAHAGNGILLYACQRNKNFDLPTAEKALADQLSHHSLPTVNGFELEPEVIIGKPLLLTRTSKLNFKRAVKAAAARMEVREGSLKGSLSQIV